MIDSCVLADQKWLTPIVLTAEAGYVVPLWSPCIIAETSRLHAQLWMKRRGVPRTNADRRVFSEQAHRWFAYVSRAFQVVEDAPPPAAMWTMPPPDPYDVPIWTAAVRARAHFVVTSNLKDGPPSDSDGVRAHAGIMYVHPDPFLGLLDLWADLTATRQAKTLGLSAAALRWQEEQTATRPLPEPLSIYMERLAERLAEH
jgi:PIN domain